MNNNWADAGAAEFSALLPVISAKTKMAKTPRSVSAIFKTYTNGINTARDSWVYGRTKYDIEKTMLYFSKIFAAQKVGDVYSDKIKWSRNLKDKHASGAADNPLGDMYTSVNYRPFQKRVIYNSSLLIDEPGLAPALYPAGETNPSITISDTSSRSLWTPFSSLIPIDFHFGSTSDGYKAIPRYRFDKSGERIDNITDWAFNKFVKEYGKKGVTKDAIFHYIYGVLHDPVYREAYALNLKREFPRIPFYPNFAGWVAWGETLMTMHIGYEDVTPWPIKRIETPATRPAGTHPKPILKSQPEQGVVVVDADTQIVGIPPEAWTYYLGNRSAIDWVLDQHKEKKPRDPTIAAKFNTYRFADYKESMIELLAKVVRISVDTVAITDAMGKLDRST